MASKAKRSKSLARRLLVRKIVRTRRARKALQKRIRARKRSTAKEPTTKRGGRKSNRKSKAKNYVRKPRLAYDYSHRLIGIQAYPLVLQAEFDKVKIVSPDFEVVNDKLPALERLSKSQRKKYYAMLGEQVLRAWSAAEKVRQKMVTEGKHLPLPQNHTTIRVEEKSANFMSPDELAARIKCHKDTVRRAIDRGELKAVLTPGGHRRVAKNEARRWINVVLRRK